MVWFRVDDVLPFHARVLEAGNAAMGLWVRAGAWSAGQLTDGHVPTAVAKQLGSPAEIRRLVLVGLWTIDEERGGYLFHAWAEDGTGTKRQPTRAEVESQRKAERDRKAAYRAGRKEGQQESDSRPTGVPVGQTPDNQQASGHPDPTRPDPLPSEGGAHTTPPVDNSVDNSPPSPFCPKHPGGTDRPCRPCGDARRAHDTWQAPAPAPRQIKHIPGLCDDHRQPENTCEMCAYENAHAAAVIHGRFGGAA